MRASDASEFEANPPGPLLWIGLEPIREFFVSPPTRLAYRNAVGEACYRLARRSAGTRQNGKAGAALPRGVCILSFETEKDADRRRKSGQPAEAETSSRSQPMKKKGPASADVGSALRSVYQRAVDEQIPPDLLDLLGKLG